MSTPPALSDLSDQHVVALALTGDERAHRVLYDRYHGPIATLLYHMVGDHHLAEDLTQVTFSKVSMELHTYRPEHKFAGWIFAIANHVGVDQLRKTRNRPDTLTLDTTGPITSPSGKIRGIQVAATTDSTPNPVRLWRELGPEVEQALERLRREYRVCVTLRFRQGKSYQEIARITHLPIGTVASNVVRALEQLREMLGPKLDSLGSDPPPPNTPRSDPPPPPTA